MIETMILMAVLTCEPEPWNYCNAIMYNPDKDRYQIEPITLYDDVQIGAMYAYECGVTRHGGCYVQMTRVYGRKCRFVKGLGTSCELYLKPVDKASK